jgi:hypothetical protein
MSAEVLLAGGYAFVLVLAGTAFERMASHAERDAFDSEPSGLRAGRRTPRSARDDPSFAHLHAARFHRGLALILCVCAVYILVIVAARHPAPAPLAVLAGAALLPGWLAFRIVPRLFGKGVSREHAPRPGR